MNKKIIAVRFEGTISNTTPDEAYNGELGDLIPVSVEALKKLEAAGHEIIIVSTAAGSSFGFQRLLAFLLDNAVPYTDVWSGFCLPVFDYLVDDKSLDLSDKTLSTLGVTL